MCEACDDFLARSGFAVQTHRRLSRGHSPRRLEHVTPAGRVANRAAHESRTFEWRFHVRATASFVHEQLWPSTRGRLMEEDLIEYFCHHRGAVNPDTVWNIHGPTEGG